MHLHIYKDAEFIVLLKALSIIAGFYHLPNTPRTSEIFLRNGAVLVEFKTLRHVILSASEEEVGGVSQNTRMEIQIITTLEALGNL